MLLLGILAFLQITLIPGVIILKVLNFHGTILQRIIYAFALSLMASYFLVILLTTIHMYNQTTLGLLIIGEMVWLIRLYKEELRLPFFGVLQNQIEMTRETINAIFAPGMDKETSNDAPQNPLNVLLAIILLVLAFAGVVWAVRIFIGNLGSVFDEWDAVVSWNRWALNWASGQIPLDSGVYPQLIPANWSLTYVLIGDTIVQAFAKGIMPLFAVFILLSLFDLGLESRSFGFFISGIFAQLLLKKFLGAEITNGYVDVALAFFSMLAIHALIMAGNASNALLSDRYLLLGAIFAAGAAVTKQPGLYIFALYPVLFYVHVLRLADPKLKTSLKKYLVPFLLVSLIPLSWYAFKQVHTFLTMESLNLQEYFDVTANTYGNIGFTAQIIAALSLFEKYLLLFVFIIAGLPLLSPFYRALTILVILPYPFIWAWIAGYDTRNLAIFVPVFALTAGVALQELYIFAIKVLERTPFFRMKNYFIPVIFLVVVIAGSLAIPSSRLVEQQTQLQKLIFSPSKNAQIYALIEREGPATKILTNYPVRFLPGLDNNQVLFGFQNLESFIALAEGPEIHYVFFTPSRTSDEIQDYIEGKINAGDYEVVFVDKEWIPYNMIRIIKR